MVHHEDYLTHRADQALCGVTVEHPVALDRAANPVAVCADCEAKLVEYHLKWWREKAEAATAELDELRVAYRAMAKRVDDQHGDAVEAHVTAGPSEDNLERAEDSEPTPASFLAQARKELLELCRQFDDAVPYWRVKNTMDAFSDRLSTDERVLLAQEIGADGSLIRWCTAEIESLGWRVTNNPVTGEAEDMMDAWTHDLYQPPKKTKWRLGRAR